MLVVQKGATMDAALDQASEPDATSATLSPALSSTIAEAWRWSSADIDPETQREARELIAQAEAGDAAAAAELLDAFDGRLAFGTAGLRGKLGAGPRRMNRVVVAQTSAGFAAYLRDRAAAGQASTPPSVVIGYDARVNSDVFAVDAAEVMAGAGLTVFLLPEAGPTPLTAFAVRFLGASAGIMITASHNPPRDNGYKVYLGDDDAGSQIVPPVDAAIAAHIERIAGEPLASLPRSAEYRTLGSEVADAYVAQTSAAMLAGLPSDPAAAPGTALGAATDLTVAYTAMHGVGAAISRRVFTACGLPTVTPVPEQEHPDGAFPTVAFPNPEEPGALDLAYRTATAIAADLIVAHDPDADRLAIAAPLRHADATTPASSDGGGPSYRALTGNELGLLLGWRAAEREHQRAACASDTPRGTLACTIVSSPSLRAVAEAYGLDYAETLSGFKWVSRVPGLLFGFEEALGYLSFPDTVRDKDGISASADAIAMVRELKAQGRTIWDLLDEASERFGHFASGQITLRLPSMAAASALSSSVRADPPTAFAGIKIVNTQDLMTPGLAAVQADVLRYDLADGARVMIRPSGTEPKLKIYLDTMSDEGDAATRRHAAESALAQLETAVNGYLDGLQQG